jgi:hypothetical protein
MWHPLMGRSQKRKYYCIGWTARDADAGVFREMHLPGNRVMRVMDKSVHQAALASACDKLLELGRKSGKKESAL